MKLACLVFVVLAAVSAQGVWIDSHYTDFMQGSYDAEIYVSRRLELEADPADSGCVEYHARFDLNNDGWYDLVSPAAWGPYLKVWLGSRDGYSSSRYLAYPITDGGDCDVSDLDLDGNSELVHSGYVSGSACIYWGTATGPAPGDTTLLPNDGGEAIYVADFDKDTYLDIAVAGVRTMFYVYWGSAYGYSVSNRFELALGPMAHNMEAADLDMNGYLDPVVVRLANECDVVILYQKSPRVFAPMPLEFSRGALSPHGLSIGDFDMNHHVDIVATGYVDISYSSIYWGRPSGYSSLDRIDVNPGECYGGSGVGDFDGDGWLDILYFRKDGRYPAIYYNLGAYPYFSDANKKEVGAPVDATGGVVADFNYDGYLDIFVNNRSTYSYVLYGPSFTSYDSLPIAYDHHGMFREPRQIPSYYSRVARPCSIGADTLVLGGRISWTARTPGDSKVTMSMRAGDTPAPDSLWTGWYPVVGDSVSGPLPREVCGGHLYMQYRADLLWRNPAELPSLERVELDLVCGNIDTLCQPVEPWAPMTQGYWRRQCKDRTNEDVCAYVDSVRELADLFDSFDCDSICDLMSVDPPEKDMCRKARRQFMALLLNIASGKLSACNCLEDRREVGDVVADVDSILSVHAGLAACEQANTLADDLNNGRGIVICDRRRLQVPPKAASLVVKALAPNPFTDRTVVEYEALGAGGEEVRVYDTAGRLVRTLDCVEAGSGTRRAEWEGVDEKGLRVPSGIYFIQLKCGGERFSRTVIRLR